MKVIGITGFIGSGKSTVCKFFEKLGAIYVDADQVTHELYESGQAGAKKIELFFGEKFLNKKGSVNRRKLGKVVFGDPRKLKILNNLIHPLVTVEIERRLKSSDADLCVLEAFMFEKKHLGRLVDSVLWVERKIDPVKAKILNLQKKPERVDFSLNNNGSKKDLENKVKKLWQKIMSQ